MTTKVNIRTFTRNIYNYLKAGEYVVTKNGNNMLKVVVTPLNNNNVVSNKADNVMTDDKCKVPGCDYDVYTQDGLCMKHWKE